VISHRRLGVARATGLALAILLAWAGSARARSLADVFRRPDLASLELAPLGPALADAVATTYPVASASSSITYAFNPATETFERQTRILGPILGERAETIGERQLDLALSYSYVRFSEINGEDLDNLENSIRPDHKLIAFPIVRNGQPSFVKLRDGRLTTFLPVHVNLDLDVEAQILSPSVTYGITPDLDVNVTVPVIRTYLRLGIHDQVPDPRLPQFALPDGDPNAQSHALSTSESSVGVGDILLRAKYVLMRGTPFDLAAGLGISTPTGNPQDFQGTGTTRVQPTLIASRVFFDRIEPLLNLGMDLNANDVSRSVVRWAVGATGRIVGDLGGALVFFGRNELAPQADQIAVPFFFQIERNDLYDASIGFRYLFADRGVIAANVLVPLNSAGLRADAIPTIEAELTF